MYDSVRAALKGKCKIEESYIALGSLLTASETGERRIRLLAEIIKNSIALSLFLSGNFVSKLLILAAAASSINLKQACSASVCKLIKPAAKLCTGHRLLGCSCRHLMPRDNNTGSLKQVCRPDRQTD